MQATSFSTQIFIKGQSNINIMQLCMQTFAQSYLNNCEMLTCKYNQIIATLNSTNLCLKGSSMRVGGADDFRFIFTYDVTVASIDRHRGVVTA